MVGHRGFVGSAIAAYLRSVGADVVGIDRTNYDEHRGTTADLLVNAGGSSDRRLAQADPGVDFDQNVTGTLHVLRDLSADRYVHLSTIEVYADPTSPAHTEEDVAIDPAAQTPYGFHKYLSELVVRRYARQWAILRVGPLVGPGLRKNSIYDLLVRRTLFVHPDSTLQYLDTRELASLTWALRDADGEVVNLCGTGTVRLRDIAVRLGVTLAPEHEALPMQSCDVSVAKLRGMAKTTSTRDTVERFLGDLQREPNYVTPSDVRA